MATINLSPTQFAEVAVGFLLDKMLHPDEVATGNEEFEEFNKSMKAKGMKSTLTNYYLKMDSGSRLNYKRIKDIFDGSTNDPQNIRILPEKKIKKKDKKEKEGFIKRVGKAVLKKLIGQGPLSLDKEEWKILNETIDYMDQIREEDNLNG